MEIEQRASRARDRAQLAFGTIKSRCVPAAACLLHELRRDGVNGRLVCGYYLGAAGSRDVHTWILLDDDRIVDPTREQFEPGRLVTDGYDACYQMVGFAQGDDDLHSLLGFWGWREELREQTRFLATSFAIFISYPGEQPVPLTRVFTAPAIASV